MAYIIDAEECIGCAACEDECPTGAIVQDGDKYKIIAEECIDCGACEDTCPTQAISPE